MTQALLLSASMTMLKSIRAPSPYTIVDYGSASEPNYVNSLVAGIATTTAKCKRVIFNDIDAVAANQAKQGFLAIKRNSNVDAAISTTSFFRTVQPNSTVSMGVCVLSAHFMSKLPPGRSLLYSKGCRPQDVRSWDKQALHDWTNFIRSRSAELVSNGRLLVVMNIRDHLDRPFPPDTTKKVPLEPNFDEDDDLSDCVLIHYLRVDQLLDTALMTRLKLKVIHLNVHTLGRNTLDSSDMDGGLLEHYLNEQKKSIKGTATQRAQELKRREAAFRQVMDNGVDDAGNYTAYIIFEKL